MLFEKLDGGYTNKDLMMCFINSIPELPNNIQVTKENKGTDNLKNICLLLSIGVKFVTSLHEFIYHLVSSYLFYLSSKKLDSDLFKEDVDKDDGGFCFERLLKGDERFQLLNLNIILVLLDGVSCNKNLLEFQKDLKAKINIDDGLRNSMLTTIHFLGTIVAALIGVVVMGVDLTNLALIAGALSIGIGFGLQNIINNLVSGLIILFERPFNVGDWVVINGEEGKIKQVNIRSTIVETFRRSNVIIPNANLLSSSVINLTRDNTSARYAIKVGVAYGSDVEKVKKVLLECADNCKFVLKNPAPYVLFQDFGASSLDFELRFYVQNVWNDWQTPSDLRFDINHRFEEEGIEIPFQQIVIHNAKDK